jgi:hypothetical protein
VSMSAISLSKPHLLGPNGRRIKRTRPGANVSAVAIADAANEAHRLGLTQASTATEGQKRARLMLLAKANLHVSKLIPEGSFFTIKPHELSVEDRQSCPFDSTTLVLHPNDLDRAIEHFEKEKEAEGPRA